MIFSCCVLRVLVSSKMSAVVVRQSSRKVGRFLGRVRSSHVPFLQTLRIPFATLVMQAKGAIVKMMMEKDVRGCTILLAAVQSGKRDIFRAALDALRGDILIKVSFVASVGPRRIVTASRKHCCISVFGLIDKVLSRFEKRLSGWGVVVARST